MPRKLRQLRSDMRKVGARPTTQQGSHEKWKHPLVPNIYVELAGHDGADAKPYQEKDVRTLLNRIEEAEKEEAAKRRQQP